MNKASFTVGVFGTACRIDTTGTLRIMVNVRTDQELQRRSAGLLPGSQVEIIDLPGGTAEMSDFIDHGADAMIAALDRKVWKQTGGCTFEKLGAFSYPLLMLGLGFSVIPTTPVGDLAFWMPIRLFGTPQPTDEAAYHPWISLAQLKSQVEYRCPGKLGLEGRTGKMLTAAFKWFKNRTHIPEYFSV